MFRYISKAIGIAGYVIQYGCITHCTVEYLGDFVVCDGPSMEPTLYSNNVLITERISSRLNRLQRGDIIIAKCPRNPTQHICKRIIGLPGDRVAINPPLDIDYFIKSKADDALEEDMTSIIDKTGTIEDGSVIKRKTRQVIVPRGHVWIEGDNSENSADSRYYGPIPQGLIRSRAVYRIWPLDDMKMLI